MKNLERRNKKGKRKKYEGKNKKGKKKIKIKMEK